MRQDIRPAPVHDSGFFEDLDVFFDGAVRPLRGGSQVFNDLVPFGSSGDFIDETRIILDVHVLCKSGSIVKVSALRDIVLGIEIFEGVFVQFETTLKATKGKMRPLRIVFPRPAHDSRPLAQRGAMGTDRRVSTDKRAR